MMQIIYPFPSNLNTTFIERFVGVSAVQHDLRSTLNPEVIEYELKRTENS